MGIIKQSELISLTFETNYKFQLPVFELYQNIVDGDERNISIDKEGAFQLIRELLKFVEEA